MAGAWDGGRATAGRATAGRNMAEAAGKARGGLVRDEPEG